MHKYVTIISEMMNESNENDVVRLSNSGRSKLQTSRQELIEVWTRSDGSSVLLPVKPAYKKDIDRAKHTGVRLKDAIFVSSNVASMFEANNRSNVWVDKKPRRCAIGSDPEILMLKDGSIAYAGHHLPFNGQIGSDGPLLEIRPNPGSDAEEHVVNIKSIIDELPAFVSDASDISIDNLNFMCLPFADDDERSYTAGGHIHLGVSSYLHDGMLVEFDDNEFVFKLLNHVLNIGLALPMQSIDGDIGILRRHLFGAPDDMRYMVDRLEFRTLSSSWLLYQDLATIVLKIAHELTIETSKLLIDYLKGGNPTYNYDTALNDILGIDTASAEVVESILCENGVSAIGIERYSQPVLEKLIEPNLMSELLTITTNCHLDNLNVNVIQNWNNNVSIKETF